MSTSTRAPILEMAQAILRRGLDRTEAADTVTALASPEVYASLVELSVWTASRYETWLAETLARLLLED